MLAVRELGSVVVAVVFIRFPLAPKLPVVWSRMTTSNPQSTEWDGFLGRAPDYKATAAVNRLVWADLSQGLFRDAYPRFPRDTEAAHEKLERLAAAALPGSRPRPSPWYMPEMPEPRIRYCRSSAPWTTSFIGTTDPSNRLHVWHLSCAHRVLRA